MKLSKDKYKSTHADKSKVYKLHCSECKTYLLTYLKDGDGTLKRLYLDKIIRPVNLANLKNDSTILSVEDLYDLRCSKCDSLIGIPILHEDGLAHRSLSVGGRFAFELEFGSLYKELLK